MRLFGTLSGAAVPSNGGRFLSSSLPHNETQLFDVDDSFLILDVVADLPFAGADKASGSVEVVAGAVRGSTSFDGDDKDVFRSAEFCCLREPFSSILLCLSSEVTSCDILEGCGACDAGSLFDELSGF